jgi:hypothetical protein
VKSLPLLLLTLSLLIARENPFEPVYNLPKVQEDIIPLLNIKTSPAFQSPTTLVQAKSDTRSLPLSTPKKIVPSKESAQATCNETKIKETPTITTKPSKVKVKKSHKKDKKRTHYRTIYKNYFLKVVTNGKYFKIFSNDRLLQKQYFSHPKRVALDFERLQYFHTKNITMHSKFVNKVKFGSHHEFYRITLELKNRTKSKLIKKPYGYLLTLY